MVERERIYHNIIENCNLLMETLIVLTVNKTYNHINQTVEIQNYSNIHSLSTYSITTTPESASASTRTPDLGAWYCEFRLPRA